MAPKKTHISCDKHLKDVTANNDGQHTYVENNIATQISQVQLTVTKI